MSEITLRALADRRGILVGAACSPKMIDGDMRYRDTLAREFNAIVAENCMKFTALQPERGRFDFTDADALTAFAQAHHQRMRGHTLVWHYCLPAWMTEGDFSKTQALDILQAHIFTVLDHFRGTAFSWDVVNEGLADDGGWRDTSPWFRFTGRDYLAQAFRWAHEADPTLQLFYNDYGMELPGPKVDACYQLLRELLDQGVPVHGVGFQCHLGWEHKLDRALVTANIRRFRDLGLAIHFTEMDMGIQVPVTDERRRIQAVEYANRLAIARDAGVTALMLWGFTDRYSWIPGFSKGEHDDALIFDRDYHPKPAYTAFHEALEAWDAG